MKLTENQSKWVEETLSRMAKKMEKVRERSAEKIHPCGQVRREEYQLVDQRLLGRHNVADARPHRREALSGNRPLERGKA